MKQVPAAAEGNMDPETGLLIRAGLETVANVYDLAALEAALRIREETGGEIHVFTMGPEKAQEVLRTAFAMGADEGYLICDPAFAGADVLATSYTLMQAIRAAGTFDLILCGRQTTDGDTAQVSGALAHWMGLFHLNWVTELKIEAGKRAAVRYYMEGRTVQAEVELPCLLAVERDSFLPRMPSLQMKIRGRKKEIHVLTRESLADTNPEHYGQKGSATRVKKIFPPERTARKAVVTLEKEAAADYILGIIRGCKNGEVQG
jgi:electron transfer flavoprotein beta subunit